MIGVTLSYVYNLIDETIPFSTRSTTLERIAIVMEIQPEEFDEYKIEFPYDYIGKVDAYFRKKDIEITSILYNENVEYHYVVEEDISKDLLELSNGSIHATWVQKIEKEKTI